METIDGIEFEIIKKLGKGSFGYVYKVRLASSSDTKEYALKVIQEKGDEGIKSLKEVDILSRLKHPNLTHAKLIVSEYNLEDDVTKVGILMDLAKRDLFDTLVHNQPTVKTKIDYMKQITKGMLFLHQQNYLHMDIKPANILIFDGNVAKLSDFGLALKMQENKYKDFPVSTITIDHRSINILKGERRYTPADDVWALGITFIEVFSGGYSLFSRLKKGEYTEENILEIIMKKLSPKKIMSTLERYIPKMDKVLKAKIFPLIAKMLDFDSEKRIPGTEILRVLTGETKIGGSVLPTQIYPPTVCDQLSYEGFDVLIRLSVKIWIKTETFFLAADIYQRSLAFRRDLVESNDDQNYNNMVYQAALSIYMAIKMIEGYYADTDKIAFLTGYRFSPKDLIMGECFLANNFEGHIYPNNLFTNSTTKARMIESFKLSRNCHVYRKIDLDQWKILNDQEAIDGDEIYDEKWGFFIDFLELTDYDHLLNDDTFSYIGKLYRDDLESA